MECWKKARELTKMVYQIADKFPRDRRLIDQITGSGISSMNNIAEGFDSGGDNDFLRYLGYLRNSVSEIQSCLYVALDRKYINQDKFDEITKMQRFAAN
ncbi:MAG: four helix bundle protein [Planctomycetota bacterium]